MNARELLRGALGGALLALARPPAGLTLEEWMTPTGERRALWFALALAVVALPHLVRPARGASGAATLAGCAVGFAATGLFAMDVLAPESQGVLFLMALAVLAASVLLAPRATSEAPAEPISLVWEGWLAPTAVAAAGAGLALALGAVDARLVLLDGGTRDDRTVAGAVGLAIAALGALSVAPLLSRRRSDAAWCALALAAAAIATLPSFEFLSTLSLPRAYQDLLARFSLDLDDRGTLAGDALLAARAFALPALCVGVAVAGVRDTALVGFGLLGAALATILLPHWDSTFAATTIETVARQGFERAATGAAIACGGALLAALAMPKAAAWTTRWLAIAGALACGLATTLELRASEKRMLLPLTPWEKVEPRVEWIRETPEGILTVELLSQRGRVATLDRRQLTPTIDEQRADELRWGANVGEGSVMIAGLLTPERATALWSLGVKRVCVRTPWAELDEDLDSALFAGSSLPTNLTVTRSPREFDAWVEEDPYAVWEAAPPVEATAYSTAGLEQPDVAPLRVGWMPAERPIAHLDWGPWMVAENVLASTSQLDDMTIGVSFYSSTNRHDWVRFGGADRSTPWSRLRLSRFEREKRERVRVAERLVRGKATPVTRALLLLCEAQVPSSPFESRALRTELDPRALELLRESAEDAEEPTGSTEKPNFVGLTGFERELDEAVAEILAGRRDLDGLNSFAVPLADKYPAWGAMQAFAARADWEFFDYASAANRLAFAVQASPYDLRLRVWLAEAHLRADQPQRALAEAEALLAIQPERPDGLRLRALAAARAGDERGRAWVEQWLAGHPDDAEARRHAAAGPYPPLEPPLGVPGDVPEHP